MAAVYGDYGTTATVPGIVYSVSTSADGAVYAADSDVTGTEPADDPASEAEPRPLWPAGEPGEPSEPVIRRSEPRIAEVVWWPTSRLARPPPATSFV